MSHALFYVLVGQCYLLANKCFTVIRLSTIIW